MRSQVVTDPANFICYSGPTLEASGTVCPARERGVWARQTQPCPFVRIDCPLDGRQAWDGGKEERGNIYKRCEFGIFIHAVDGVLIIKDKLFSQLTEEFIISKNNEKSSESA